MCVFVQVVTRLPPRLKWIFFENFFISQAFTGPAALFQKNSQCSPASLNCNFFKSKATTTYFYLVHRGLFYWRLAMLSISEVPIESFTPRNQWKAPHTSGEIALQSGLISPFGLAFSLFMLKKWAVKFTIRSNLLLGVFPSKCINDESTKEVLLLFTMSSLRIM